MFDIFYVKIFYPWLSVESNVHWIMRKKQNAVQYLKGTIQKHQLWQFGAHFLTESIVETISNSSKSV